MATTFDSVDLLGTDLRHPRLRPRFSTPVAPPPRAVEHAPSALPATAEMEAPVWPRVEPAPPVRVANALVTLVPAEEAPPRRVPEAPVPAVPAALAAVSVPSRPANRETPVPPERLAVTVEPLFDAMTESWFAEDPFLEERPAGLPWWVLAIPASAALGMISMVLTVLVLVAALTT